ncbi:hypothetical protein ABI59_11570 [Acidobacteria bacterium Mor1]|nr:hypothetical protein ABI59_11570 [Acidobacteria bacterium Mor1]
MPGMIYLNHVGTSWPKPPGVAEAIEAAARSEPPAWAGLAEEAGKAIAGFFGCGPERFLWAQSCTQALAFALDDFPWESGDVLLTGSLEHHALSRWPQKLAARGVVHEAIPFADPWGVDPAWVEERLARGGVRMLAFAHGCNVSGHLLPMGELCSLARKHGVTSLVDGAQSAGFEPIALGGESAEEPDMFTFAGHKGPMGPLGVGGLYVRPGVSLASPEASCDLPGGACRIDAGRMPDYCDSGSMNLPALAGLAAGVRWIEQQGIESLRSRVLDHTRRMIEGFASVPGLRVIGPGGDVPRTPAVSVVSSRHSSDELAALLAEGHGIMARPGHQCAPWAHSALGTETHGTLRFSAGPFIPEHQVDSAIDALMEVMK